MSPMAPADSTHMFSLQEQKNQKMKTSTRYSTAQKSVKLCKCLKSYHKTLSGMSLIIPKDNFCCLTVSPNTQPGSWRNICSDRKNKEICKRYYRSHRAWNKVFWSLWLQDGENKSLHFTIQTFLQDAWKNLSAMLKLFAYSQGHWSCSALSHYFIYWIYIISHPP